MNAACHNCLRGRCKARTIIIWVHQNIISLHIILGKWQSSKSNDTVIAPKMSCNEKLEGKGIWIRQMMMVSSNTAD